MPVQSRDSFTVKWFAVGELFRCDAAPSSKLATPNIRVPVCSVSFSIGLFSLVDYLRESTVSSVAGLVSHLREIERFFFTVVSGFSFGEPATVFIPPGSAPVWCVGSSHSFGFGGDVPGLFMGMGGVSGFAVGALGFLLRSSGWVMCLG